jgi:hypothetical protein
MEPRREGVVKLTRGERWALVFYALVVLGFMPPVIVWANRVEPFVLGLPFFVFWIGLVTLLTSGLMTLAFVVKDRVDRR